MTVFTKFSGDQKENEKKEYVAPLVEDKKADPEVGVAVEGPSKKKKDSICLLIFLLLLIALTSGYFFYEHFAVRQRKFHGWCSIPIDAAEAKPRIFFRQDVEDTPKLFNRLLEEDDSNSHEDSSSEMLNFDKTLMQIQTEIQRSFDEMIDIDLEQDNAVKIEVPKFGLNRPARFFNDFGYNYTAIADDVEGRCFVIPLEQELFMPPANFLELLMQSLSGYYDRAVDVIRQTSRVVTPAIQETEFLGPLINSQCSRYQIYKLERITNPIYKRSVDASKDQFVEYTGKAVLEFDILNLHDAVGTKSL